MIKTSKQMQLIDGKKLSKEIQEEIRIEVESLTKGNVRPPHLAAILMGHNPASETYVGHKVKACNLVGFASTLLRYEDDVSEEFILGKIRAFNSDPDIDGILIQLPLPKHISEEKIIETISPEKDVDGFHPINIGRMTKNLPALLPATPAGVMEMFRRYDIELKGKHCVMVGASNIVGTPMSILLSRSFDPGFATVTLTHEFTVNLASHTRIADVVIVAVGKPGLITADMIKEGAVVIDVGINKIDDESRKAGYRLVGDVDFENVAPKCSFITPVPGGVGPMTIAMLLKNTLQAYKSRTK